MYILRAELVLNLTKTVHFIYFESSSMQKSVWLKIVFNSLDVEQWNNISIMAAYSCHFLSETLLGETQERVELRLSTWSLKTECDGLYRS